MQKRFIVVLLLIVTGCSRKVVRPPATSGPLAVNDYIDLEPGSKLRIVLPPPNFEIVHYSVAGRARGRVRLQFLSAEIIHDGKTIPEPRAPVLPFTLPSKPLHIRLLYLRRLSHADHNMAVLAADRTDILESATKQIRADPNSCQTSGKFICAWVPPHVAVRPEK